MVGGLYAVVAHRYWDRPGGGELVCASTAKALEVLGYKPVLASVPRFELRDRYVEWFGIDLGKYEVVEVLGLRLRAFGIYLRLLTWLSIKKAIGRYGASIVFTDDCAYKPVEKLIKEKGVKLIEYIHFPVELSVDPRYRSSGLYYGDDPYVLERYGRFPMNLYWWGYVKLLPRFLRRNPFESASLVLANSRWTAELCGQAYGERPTVLNPPIAPNVGIVERPRGFEERANAVVMLGRFSEEKRYHWVVSELMPSLRRELGGVRLYVFGGAGTRSSLAYLSRVERLARSKGLRVSRSVGVDADVYLVPDAPRSVVNEVMDRAKVFLHATINEHWGVAVAEAMARGLPVVVHRSGGTWSDLALEGLHGLGYGSTEEAVEQVVRLLSDGRLWRSYSSKSVERARELTMDRFVERFADAVRRALA